MFIDKTTHFKMPERVPPWDGEREGKGKISTPKKDIHHETSTKKVHPTKVRKI